MSTAVPHETLLSINFRLSRLDLDISNLQDLKRDLAYAQADNNRIKAQKTEELKNFYKAEFKGCPELQEKYIDYTQMPDFEDELDKIEAEFQDELDELNIEETNYDAQLSTSSAEKEELTAYKESLKSTLQNNIKNEFGNQFK